MEDRYLFKAKRVNDGEWVVGTLLHKSSSFSIECDEYYIFDGIETSSNDDLYLVDPSTICQCTGLKDKNGNLIWENDVVTGWFDGKRITGYIMYGSNSTFFIERKGLYGIHLDNSEDWLEVIGNIFDEGSENIGKGAEEN